MNILEELWCGNINPQECGSPKDPQIDRLLSLVVKNEDALLATLSDTQKERYEKLSDCQGEMAELLKRRAFAEGFRLAARMMAEVMNTDIPPLEC